MMTGYLDIIFSLALFGQGCLSALDERAGDPILY